MYLFCGRWGKIVPPHVSLKNTSVIIKRVWEPFLPGLWPPRNGIGAMRKNRAGVLSLRLSLGQETLQGGDNRDITCLLLLSPHHLNQTHYLGKYLEIPLHQIKDEMTLSPKPGWIKTYFRNISVLLQHSTCPKPTGYKCWFQCKSKMDKHKTRKTGTGRGGQRSARMELLLCDLKVSLCLLVSVMVTPRRDEWRFQNIHLRNINSPPRQATGIGMWFAEQHKVKVNLFPLCNKVNQGNKGLPKKDPYRTT